MSRFRIVIPALLLLVATAAQACPACSEAVANQEDRMPQGYAASIYLMLGVPALILAGFSGSIWWMYRKRRKVAAESGPSS